GTDAVTKITGYRRQKVHIKCPYTSGYENYTKYFCRGKCSNLVWSNDVPVQSGSPAKDSRFSLHDDTTAKVFTVTITDLRREDEGTYWCVTKQIGRDIYTEIHLVVKRDVHALGFVSPSTHPQSTQTSTVSTAVHPETTLSTIAGTDAVTTVTGYRGRSVQIKCPYTFGYENYNKYLCRHKCSTWNHNDVPVQSGSPAKDSRFSLHDDTTAKVFTVTITDLRPEDGGTYWCAIQQIGPDKYTEILLLVKMDEALSIVSNSTHPQSKTQTHTLSSSVHPEISAP
ncbi:CMRF35-like molecule 1 isoform X1, partial [Clarias magur]